MTTTQTTTNFFRKVHRKLTVSCLHDVVHTGMCSMMLYWTTLWIIMLNFPDISNAVILTDDINILYAILFGIVLICAAEIIYNRRKTKEFVAAVKEWKAYYKEHNKEIAD